MTQHETKKKKVDSKKRNSSITDILRYTDVKKLYIELPNVPEYT